MANDSDIRSLMTLSSKSEGSTAGPQAKPRWRNTPLHERCTMTDMVKIKEAFQAAYRNKILPNEFRALLKTLLNVEYDDEDYKILFLKINTNRDGEIDWDELVSHLLLGYFANDAENQREALQLPIMGLPTILRSQHRHPISRICFCPDVSKDRRSDPMQGTYITASRDGMINWWSLDLALLRTAFSSSPHLKVRTTWVTDMVCMPDVNIIVTSSTERDLRFYDCTAKTFTLKIVITSWEYMICTMHYHFHTEESEKCILICGDVGGNVRVLLFSPVKRGPFRNEAGRALIQLRHVDLQKRPHLLPEMRLVELVRVHSEWVRQVSFYASLHCVVSCATCPDSLLMTDVAGSKTHNMFCVDKGIQCFAFEEEAHVLVTGGPDCVVRVWNPFVPAKPSVVLLGHHAGVTSLVLQNAGQTVYSLSRDRVIKVWDVQGQVCVQTYIDIPAQVGERTPISAVYNRVSREYILAAVKLAVVVLDEQLNPQHTDGFTHSRAVANILYNPLFKVVVTCGMDSIIINWDPVTGKRNAMVRDAHTRLLHGELIPVEITAACFDPGYQLLLTGARNGTLKDPGGGVEPARDGVLRHGHGLDGQELGDAAHGRRAGRGCARAALARHLQLQLRAAHVEAGDRPALQTVLVHGADAAHQDALQQAGRGQGLAVALRSLLRAQTQLRHTTTEHGRGPRVPDRVVCGDAEGARAPRVVGGGACARAPHAPAGRARHDLPRDAPLPHERRRADAVPGERAGAVLVRPPGGRLSGLLPGHPHGRRLHQRLRHRPRQPLPLLRHHRRVRQGVADDQLPHQRTGAHQYAEDPAGVPIPAAGPHRGPRQAQRARPAAAAAAQQLPRAPALHLLHGLHRRAQAAAHWQFGLQRARVASVG